MNYFANLSNDFFVCFYKFTTPATAMNNFIKYFFLCSLSLFLPFLSLYSQTGPNNPSAIVNDGSNGGVATWTTPENAAASDNFYANATGLSMGQPTQFIKAAGFGFAIDPCDIIVGIEAKFEWNQVGTVTENAVYLVVNDVIQTTVNRSTGAVLPATDGITIFGSPADLWGQTLKGADVNKPGFGVVAALAKSGGGSGTVNIDHITLTIYHSASPPMSYNSGNVSQVTTPVNPNTQNNQIIRMEVVMNNGCPPLEASSFTFNMNGTTDLTDIDNAKLFFTGTNPVFNAGNQLGSTITPVVAGNFTINGFTQPLLDGTNYFWLAADVVTGATLGNVVDAECSSVTVDGIARLPSVTAPAGNRTITAPDIYAVGAAQTYFTIQAAYNAIPSSPTNGSVIEIYSDYNSASETFPITFGNKSNAFDITVRPHASATGIICAGSLGSNGIWVLDNAQKITIDGRPGGAGTVKEFTVKNTKTTSPYGTAFVIQNDSRNITLQHLIIEAETNAGAGLDGIITIGTTTGANGNDNINVLSCLLRDLTAGGSAVAPFTGVYSSGALTKSNDFIMIDNCEFSDGGLPAINIYSNSGNAIITNNHVYYSGGMAIGSTAAQFINITSGSDHEISGNFLGGSGPNCGGVQFQISSGTANVTAINIDAGGNNIIENNTISNTRYTTTYNLTSYPFIGIQVAGNGNYTIGSSGKGNTIGSILTNSSFRLTHNGTSGSGIAGIRIVATATGTVNIAYNTIAGLALDGSKTSATTELISVGGTSSSGSIIIENNTVGSALSNSINILSDSPVFCIFNSARISGITCNNNTFQNISHSATSTHTIAEGITNLAGPFICSGNTIKSLSTPSNNSHYAIRHQGTTATISSNTIQDISLTNSGTSARLTAIHINSTSDVTCNSNTIGSTTINNISIAGNSASRGIFKSGTGTLTCNSNTIQQINMTSTGSFALLRGIEVNQGILSASSNTITDNSVTGNAGGLIGNIGILCTSISAGHSITKNIIKDIHSTTTNPVQCGVAGIYAQDGNGTISQNFVTSLTNQSTAGNADITGIQTLTGSWTLVNNIIILDNSPYTNDLVIYGLEENESTLTTKIYHNTVKIGGTISSGIAESYAFFGGSGTDILQNNVFQNLRAGGTGLHVALGYTSGGTYTSDYNFFDGADPANLFYWNAVPYDFINYKINSGADNNSFSEMVVLDGNGFVISTLFSGADAGANMLGTVDDDQIDFPRDATPWMGAYETPLNLYWVGGTGNWNDPNHWSVSSGGTGGAGIPYISSDAFVDNSSGTVTISIPSGTWYTKGFTMSGAGAKASITGPGTLLPRP